MAPVTLASVVVGVGASSLQALVDDVNSKQNSWVAAVPSKFLDEDDVANYLGAHLPGDDQFSAPEVRTIVESAVAPDSFDAVTQWPECSVIGWVRDQSACGCCWAFASASSFEARSCIAGGGDIKYSAEDVCFCSNAGNGCGGGNSAWSWLSSSGVVTGGDYQDIGDGKTCYPFILPTCAHHMGHATKSYPQCPDQEYPSPSCKRQCTESAYPRSYQSDKMRADSSYSVRGVSQIQQELMTNGPLWVAFSVYADFPLYKSGVYRHTSGEMKGGHAVTMVGWGTLNGEPYWKIKNSWNEEWGDNGFFLIARGNNECGIEDAVSAGRVNPPPAPPSPGPSPPRPTPEPTPSPSPSPSPGACHAISAVVTDDWCAANCAAGFCPSDLCECDRNVLV